MRTSNKRIAVVDDDASVRKALCRLLRASSFEVQAFAAACLFLAFWVERQIWLIGLGLIGAGLLWHAAARRLVG